MIDRAAARRGQGAAALLLWTLTLGLACAGAEPSDPSQSASQAMLEAEDARVATDADLDHLIDGLESGAPALQRQAVRAVGRLERPGLHFLIQPLMRASSPDVRAEAVNAFAQAAVGIARPMTSASARPVDVSVFSDALLDRLAVEEHPDVLAVICEALGHLPYRSAGQVSESEAAMVQAARAADPVGATAVALGVVKGLESLFRLQRQLARPADATVALLQEWVRSPPSDDSREANRLDGFFADAAPRARRLAVAALGVADRLDADTIAVALDAGDPQVRRLAVVGLASLESDDRDRMLETATADDSPMVRVAAVRTHGALGEAANCRALVQATRDDSMHVALEAVDRLSACETDDARRTLRSLVAQLPEAGDADGDWHRPTRALVALSRVDAGAAASALPSFVTHPVWQVRAYSARAAMALGDRGSLDSLAADAHPNVVHAGLRGLVEVAGRDADAAYVRALGSDDYQVVRIAALALERQGAAADADAIERDAAGAGDATAAADAPAADGPSDAEIADALLDALDRLTAERRDTSRDARVAVIERLAQLGSAAQADRLRPYIRDFDARVATRAAVIVRRWTGIDDPPRPEPLDAPPVPDAAERERLSGARARITMASGGSIVLRLLAAEAPVTVSRFARLAGRDYYDGLTFHRVVPNFVIQGGSPGANEFVGDGPYLRDELGLRPHVRGSVGISTRGRDTGDAQIFVDLVDNPRLDHNYTVFAQVESGMDVVDTVLEGDVIRDIEILE